MSDDRAPVARRINRGHVFKVALVGVVLVGVALRNLFTGRGGEAVLIPGVLGLVSLLAAVIGHRQLLRRDLV